MLKQMIISTLLCSACATTHAETAPEVPMFTEVQVAVFNGEKPTYKATVIIPRGQIVVSDSLEDVTAHPVCEPNHTMSPITHKKGFRIAIASDAFGANTSVGNYGFDFASVTKEGVRNLNGCKWDNLIGQRLSVSGGMLLKNSEEMKIGSLEGPNLRLRLIGSYKTAPLGKTPGTFYALKM